MSDKTTRSIIIAVLAVLVTSAPLSADDGSASFYFACDVDGAECEYSCSTTETSEFANDACFRDGDAPGNLYCGNCDRQAPLCRGAEGCDAIVDVNECNSSELGCFFDEPRGACNSVVICGEAPTEGEGESDDDVGGAEGEPEGDAPVCVCVRVPSRETPRASFAVTGLALAVAFGIGVGRKQR